MINGFKVITLCGSTRFKEEFLKQIGEEKYKQYCDEYDKYMKEMFSPDE